MVESTFAEFAILLLIATVIGGIATLLRQPLIVSFIFVGLLVGPAGLDLIRARAEMELLASIGIALLLFVVGLKLDLQVIRSLGLVALATGCGQVLFTSLIGYGLARSLGLEPMPSLYVAVALTFSSTIIIVKLLTDKREIDALHGRIAVGFLIVQDLIVIVVLIGLAALGSPEVDAETAALLVLASGAALLMAVGLLAWFVLPHLVDRLARSQELLILFAIAWAVFLATVGDALGLGKEVGAFLAGVSLASTPYREAIAGRLVSLRDFLLLFFFLSLGANLDLAIIGAQIAASIVLSLFVLIGNPLIVMIIMGIMGYRRRTGLLAGLTVAQISEFSLILAAMGVAVGHIDEEVVGLITLVGLITITLSTYMILHSHSLYEWLSPWLKPFQRRVTTREQTGSDGDRGGVDVILFGLGRYGHQIGHCLHRRGASVLGVDFDPQAVARWHGSGGSARYGDAEDPEFAASLPLARSRWVAGAMPSLESNLSLLKAVRAYRFQGAVALTAHSSDDAERLQQAGADLVLLPFADAAERASELLGERLDLRRQ